mgnify:FL=1
MRSMKRAVVVSMVLLGASTAMAAPYQASIDLSGLGGADLQLEMILYDNSGVIGDSWVFVDNVMLGSAMDDFEDGTLGAFNDSLNPDSVGVMPGSFTDTGNFLMRIDEDPVFFPTIAYRDYSSPDGDVLTFDFELITTGEEGFFGPDEFVVSLLNPDTLGPLVPGLTDSGDVLVITAEGPVYSDTVAVQVIPAPGALLLGLIGVGTLRRWRKAVG